MMCLAWDVHMSLGDSVTWSRFRAMAPSTLSPNSTSASGEHGRAVPVRRPQDSGHLDQNGKVVQSLSGPWKHVPRRGGHADHCDSIICDTDSLIAEGKGAIKIWGPPKTLTTMTSPRRLLRLVCLPILHSPCTNSTSLRLTRPLSIFLGGSSPSRFLCCLDVPFLQRFQVWFPESLGTRQATIPLHNHPPSPLFRDRHTDRLRLEDLTIQPTSLLYLSLLLIPAPALLHRRSEIRDPRSAVAPHLSPEPRADPCLTHGINTRPLPRQRRRSLQPYHTSHLAPRQAPHKLTSPTSPDPPLGCDDNPASESRLGKLSN